MNPYFDCLFNLPVHLCANYILLLFYLTIKKRSIATYTCPFNF